MPDMQTRILIICNDHIGSVMAGPGIRSWELAQALSRRGHETAVLSRRVEEGFTHGEISFMGPSSFFNLIVRIRRADVVIQAGRPFPILFALLFRKKIIFDQYDPVVFEVMEKRASSLRERFGKGVMLLLWELRQRIILRFGDAFLVANEKQKDFLIGQLAILDYWNKVPSVSVLPFGLPEAKPAKKRFVLRGTKIRDTDFLLVWGGGIWDWFDPFTLLHALAKITSRRDDIKAYFPGLRPPSPDSEKMSLVDEFLTETRRLGLLDRAVFVNTAWTPYEERADYLLEADAGISLHRDSLETRFAFRTRMLDYVWAGLPIIASQGDSWADVIEKQGMGITIPPGDIDAAAAAIQKLADDAALRGRCRENVRLASAEYRWDELVTKIEFP
jgi:glycosyltransferase involved in cell wall biosynthesis